MNVRLIDTTLREGLQASGGSIFVETEAMVEYVNKASQLELFNRFEIYMPGAYVMDVNVWNKLTNSKQQYLQIYVGPSHLFDIGDRQELLVNKWRMVSTTIIHKTDAEIEKLQTISESLSGSPLRVGVECAGNMTPDKAAKFSEELSSLDCVEVVTINDSNGIIGPEWVESYFARSSNQFNSTLGFHLHNDRGLALINAQTVMECAKECDFKTIELDVTAFGHGARNGILTVSDGLSLLREQDTAISVDYPAYRAEVGELFTRTSPIDVSATKDQTKSHYDNRGRLRREYDRFS